MFAGESGIYDKHVSESCPKSRSRTSPGHVRRGSRDKLEGVDLGTESVDAVGWSRSSQSPLTGWRALASILAFRAHVAVGVVEAVLLSSGGGWPRRCLWSDLHEIVLFAK